MHHCSVRAQEGPDYVSPKTGFSTLSVLWIFRVAALLLFVSALTQTISAQVRTNAARVSRVHSRVENSQRVTLRGQTVPALGGAADMGRLPGNTAMNQIGRASCRERV